MHSLRSTYQLVSIVWLESQLESLLEKVLGQCSLELIHSGVCGPMNVKARHGASYFITFIDDFTRCGHVYLVSHKSKALDCFRRFMNLVENQMERTIKTLRTDRRREYLFEQFRELFENKRDL